MYDSTGGTDIDRRDEARRLLDIILDLDGSALPHKEQEFIVDINNKFEQYGDGTRVTPKQLFWLRDIKDKML